jgi:hypothetical protein
MPNYHTSPHDKPLRTLFSSAAAHKYFTEVSTASPSLSQLPSSVISRVAENDIGFWKAFGKLVLKMICLLVVVNVLAVNMKPGSEYSSWFAGGLFFAYTSWLLFKVAYPFRTNSGELSTLWLFNYVLLLERNADAWGSPKLRDEMLRRIKKIATAVEEIPYGFHNLAPEVRRELFIASRRKAQAVRNLQHWVLTPGPFTYTDLIHRFAVDLELIASGRWRELPEAEYQRHLARWLIVVLASMGLIVLSAAVIAVALIPKYLPAFSSATPIITSILSTGAVVLLMAAGVPANLISISSSTGSKLVR